MMNAKTKRALWFAGLSSLLVGVACTATLNPQPLPPEIGPSGDGGFATGSQDASRGDNSANEDSDAAAQSPDGGLPPAPLLDASTDASDGGDAGDGGDGG